MTEEDKSQYPCNRCQKGMEWMRGVDGEYDRDVCRWCDGTGFVDYDPVAPDNE